MKRRITEEERGGRGRGGGGLLGETGESGPGRVAGQLREKGGEGIKGDRRGAKRGNDQKRSIGQCSQGRGGRIGKRGGWDVRGLGNAGPSNTPV